MSVRPGDKVVESARVRPGDKIVAQREWHAIGVRPGRDRNRRVRELHRFRMAAALADDELDFQFLREMHVQFLTWREDKVVVHAAVTDAAVIPEIDERIDRAVRSGNMTLKCASGARSLAHLAATYEIRMGGTEADAVVEARRFYESALRRPEARARLQRSSLTSRPRAIVSKRVRTRARVRGRRTRRTPARSTSPPGNDPDPAPSRSDSLPASAAPLGFRVPWLPTSRLWDEPANDGGAR